MTKLDVSGTIEIAFSPDDDTKTLFLDFLSSASKSIHIAIYSLHLPEIIPLLKSKVATGVSVNLLVDRSQALGHYEAPEIQELKDIGCDVVIGTSEKHKILHDKFAIVDEEKTFLGSWNFSLSASEEDNFILIFGHKNLAEVFLTHWHRVRDWVLKNESQYQGV